jgi:proteic killer suppression protein
LVIKTFGNAETRDLFAGRRVHRWIDIETVAMRKLAMLNRAAVLGDLRIPPANRLEALKGDRKGQYSIREWPIPHLLPLEGWRCMRRRDRGLSLRQ